MNIGELFLKIGLKGEQKTISALLKLENQIKKIGALSTIAFKLDANEFKKSIDAINKAFESTDEGLKKVKDGLKGVKEEQEKAIDDSFIGKLKEFSERLQNLFKMKFSGNLSKAFSALGRGLRSLTTLSRTTKAAILAAIYAFGRMAQKVGARATSATNTAAYTGMDVETLQKYQHIATVNESSAEAISDAFRKVSERLGEFLTLGEAPDAWYRFQEIMGREYSQQDVDYFRQNPAAFLQEVQEYAKREPIDWIRNRNIDELFGGEIGDLIRRGVFTQKSLSKAPFKSKEDIASATDKKMRINEVYARIEAKFGEFVLANGEAILSSIERFTKALLDLSEALGGLSKNTDFLQLLTGLIKAWTFATEMIFGGKELRDNHTKTGDTLAKVIEEAFFLKLKNDFPIFFPRASNDEDMIHKLKERHPLPSEENKQSNVFHINNNFNFDAKNQRNPDLVASKFSESIKDAYLNLPLTIGV